MSESIVKKVLIKAIKDLEESGEIVVVNPIENAIANKLHDAVQDVSPNMLTSKELVGIVNAINAHNLGFSLDNNDFQTIIGLTKEELNIVAKKLEAGER